MKLSTQIEEVVNPLLDSGLKVFAYVANDVRKVNWLIVEKGENVGVVGYRDYAPFGYYVTFPIKPSRETGSGLLVQTSNRNPHTVEKVVELAHVSVRDSYANFATGGAALPNHGWKHFDWAKDHIEEVERVR